MKQGWLRKEKEK